ncbi:MAG: DUF937 domain-containing protein [Lysobacteraceae bacterium]
MAGITDALQQLLDSRRIDGIAQAIGASPQQTSTAINAAIPLLLGQLSRNASTPEGAASLQNAVARDHSGGGMDLGGMLGGLLGAMSGGGSSAGGLGDGAAILGHIFGNKQPRVNAGVSQASGLNMGQVSSLLAMLAPLVMRVLGQQSQQGGGLGGLGGLLGAEAKQAQAGAGGGLLGALLDRDGDGDVDLSDLLQSGGGLLGGLFGKR